MSDFNVKVTVRNARLLSAVREKFGSAAEMARATNISAQIISSLMSMRNRPIKGNGDWTTTALNVSTALGMHPEDLWPDRVRGLRATKSIEREVSFEQALEIAGASAEARLIQSDLIDAMSEALSEREASFMNWRRLNMDATYAECGEVLGVCSARAQQIEQKAYRKMRNRAKRMHIEDLSGVVPA